jgi:alpha/beta superfamily hydrolase
MKIEDVKIGELEAEATMREGAPGVVVCHPHPAFGGRMDTPLVIALDEAISARGFSTVRFNFRGMGNSGGKPTGGTHEHEDVRLVARWMRERARKVALVGYSFGALMAMKAIADGEDAFAFAAVGFPTTILNEERVPDVERALATGIPWLFLQGDRDQFCELERVRGWQRPNVELQTLDGEGHFFTNEDAVAERVAAFLARWL